MAPPQVGVLLRWAREDRQMSLADVSARTNIPPQVLDKLERNAFDDLPGGLIVRGYLRAYGSEVGLDGEWLIGHAPASVSEEIDVIEDLRVRFRFRGTNRRHHGILQLLFVIACLVCLLYVLAVPDTARTASSDTADDASVDALDDPS
jgi:cytoskeletal protein RodZ